MTATFLSDILHGFPYKPLPKLYSGENINLNRTQHAEVNEYLSETPCLWTYEYNKCVSLKLGTYKDAYSSRKRISTQRFEEKVLELE